MTPGGWIIMMASVAGVTALFAWCIYKVMTAPEDVHVHGFEIETPDEAVEREKRERNRHR